MCVAGPPSRKNNPIVSSTPRASTCRLKISWQGVEEGEGVGVLGVHVGVLLHLVGQVGGRAEAQPIGDRVVSVVCRICVCILYCIFNEFKRIFFGM